MSALRLHTWAAVVGASWMSAATPAAESSVREQFAYSMPITAEGGAPLHRIELPLAVYRDSADAQLRDLRVLNGNGEIVPFTLRRPPPDVSLPSASVSLPLFPVRGDPVESLSNLNVVIRSESGEIDVLGGQSSAGEAPLVAYILDATRLPASIEALTFDLSADAPDFSVNLQLEASEDLAQWRTVVAHAPLARLRHGGEVFENRRVTLPPTRAHYWRVRAQPGNSLPVFAGVSASRVADSVPVERQVTEAAGQPVSSSTGEYLFDLEAQLPVDRLELVLPDINTVARVEYFARRSPGDAWRSVARTPVYRLQAPNDELRSPPLAIAPDASRYWRVVVDPQGGGIGLGIPGLRAGWLAHRVLFVARGPEPFELVFGNAAADSAEVALEDLLPGGSSAHESAIAREAPLAITGAPRLAGGIERLQPQVRPKSWRTGLLWTALLAGVLALAVMAWRLGRQMRAGGE